MNKYFEQNKYAGKDFIDLHFVLTRAYSIVASNLFFHEAKDDLKSPEHRLKLAKSAFRLIAVCEAIIGLVGEDEREKALAEVKDDVRPVDGDELMERFLEALLK
ncbi:hypothetical protein [Collinsella intestinalis]|uniref:hypothetical protein n=1 Tax=Collinsella intestinalis TaxID=147207 RepID=UPI00267172EF|nr:hypothetical protein [Collinsella intestinalis]